MGKAERANTDEVHSQISKSQIDMPTGEAIFVIPIIKTCCRQGVFVISHIAVVKFSLISPVFSVTSSTHDFEMCT